MSKIIVRKQEYANNGTHADEIKAVVREDLVVNTLSSATDLVPSVGLVKSETDAINSALTPISRSVTFNNITANFRVINRITYVSVTSSVAVALPTAWTDVSDYPSELTFGLFLSVPLVDGLVLTFRKVGNKLQYKGSASNATWVQGTGCSF